MAVEGGALPPPAELEPLVCMRCGGPLSAATLGCDYCRAEVSFDLSVRVTMRRRAGRVQRYARKLQSTMRYHLRSVVAPRSRWLIRAAGPLDLAWTIFLVLASTVLPFLGPFDGVLAELGELPPRVVERQREVTAHLDHDVPVEVLELAEIDRIGAKLQPGQAVLLDGAGATFLQAGYDKYVDQLTQRVVPPLRSALERLGPGAVSLESRNAGKPPSTEGQSGGRSPGCVTSPLAPAGRNAPAPTTDRLSWARDERRALLRDGLRRELVSADPEVFSSRAVLAAAVHPCPCGWTAARRPTRERRQRPALLRGR